MKSNNFPTNRQWWARSLKRELALGFGAVIALMLAVGAAFYLSDHRSVLAVEMLLKSNRMADLSLRSVHAMFNAHDAETDLLLVIDQPGTAEAHEHYVPLLKTHLGDLREYLTSFRIITSEPGMLDSIRQIEQLTKQYEAGFLAFVDLHGKPGQTDAANKRRQDYLAAENTIGFMLEELHTAASIQAIRTRNAVRNASNITRWTVFGMAAIAALLGAVVAVIVSRRITGSVTQLIAFSERVASGDLRARAQQGREHEFAVLAQAMNQMAQALENSQTQLMTAARQAGMAEIATEVLHNVGNVLNSVNISAELVSAKLGKSRTRGLAQAVQLMNGHTADLGDFLTRDDRGKRLPGYLSELAQALAQEQQEMMVELEDLTRNIDHIKHVVATQQAYAGVSSLVEPVQICDLAEDALRINDGALTRHQVTVVKEFAQVPVLRLDRARVLQILVNLISNAKNAIAHMTNGSRRITLRVAAAGSRLRVSVKDEGEGIAAENLTRIFAHGFTTRKAGHGFGLHSCALAASEMGGTLTAQSEGPGRGATFTLELPISTAQTQP